MHRRMAAHRCSVGDGVRSLADELFGFDGPEAGRRGDQHDGQVAQGQRLEVQGGLGRGPVEENRVGPAGCPAPSSPGTGCCQGPGGTPTRVRSARPGHCPAAAGPGWRRSWSARGGRWRAPQTPTPRVTAAMSRPTPAMRCHSPRPRTLSAGRRGGRRMASGSAGSPPSATPGRPWVSRLIHRIWAGSSGSGRPSERAEEHDQDLGGAAGQARRAGTADVGVDPPALLDGGDDGGEVVVGQDQVGGLPGDLGAARAHGHADVGAAQGGAVVDAVAGHGDDLARSLPGLRRCRASAPGWPGRRHGTSRPRSRSRSGERQSPCRQVAGRRAMMPSSVGDGAGGRGVVAGDQHRA